jgi:hypothetical protein
MKNHSTSQQDFKGFDDFIEVFRAGEQVASNGVKRNWTANELDQMVANHSAATAAPIVVGHPEHNDPAYGWVGELKRDGDSLYAKFRDVHPEFASAVEGGSYRKRSARIYKTPANTFAIEHIGFLGAARPSIPLDAMNYSAVQSTEIFDFEADWYTPNVVARVLRRLRDWLISDKGLEVADQVLPDYEITSLDRHANELSQPESAVPSPMFTAPTGEPTVTPAEHQAALDAAVAKAKEDARVEFSAQQTTLQQQLDAVQREKRTTEFNAFKQELVDAGHAPAKLEGMVEFMHHLDKPGQSATEFEFSAADGATKKVDPVKWFKDFAAARTPEVKLGKTGEHEFSAGDTDADAALVASIGAGMK